MPQYNSEFVREQSLSSVVPEDVTDQLGQYPLVLTENGLVLIAENYREKYNIDISVYVCDALKAGKYVVRRISNLEKNTAPQSTIKEGILIFTPNRGTYGSATAVIYERNEHRKNLYLFDNKYQFSASNNFLGDFYKELSTKFPGINFWLTKEHIYNFVDADITAAMVLLKDCLRSDNFEEMIAQNYIKTDEFLCGINYFRYPARLLKICENEDYLSTQKIDLTTIIHKEKSLQQFREKYTLGSHSLYAYNFLKTIKYAKITEVRWQKIKKETEDYIKQIDIGTFQTEKEKRDHIEEQIYLPLLQGDNRPLVEMLQALAYVRQQFWNPSNKDDDFYTYINNQKDFYLNNVVNALEYEQQIAIKSLALTTPKKAMEFVKPLKKEKRPLFADNIIIQAKDIEKSFFALIDKPGAVDTIARSLQAFTTSGHFYDFKANHFARYVLICFSFFADHVDKKKESMEDAVSKENRDPFPEIKLATSMLCGLANNADHELEIAKKFLQNGDYQKSEHHFKRALIAYEKTRRKEKIRECYRCLLEIYKIFGNVVNAKAACCNFINLGELELKNDIVNEYFELLKKSATPLMVLYNCALKNYKHNKFALAIVRLQYCLDTTSDPVILYKCHSFLASCYRELGQPEMALSQCAFAKRYCQPNSQDFINIEKKEGTINCKVASVVINPGV